MGCGASQGAASGSDAGLISGAGGGVANMSGGPKVVVAARIALQSNKVKEKYRLVNNEPLGCGTYASVWKVADVSDGSEWALKIIDKNDPSCDETEMKSVRWEAEALKFCRHSNITYLREIFETNEGGSQGKGFFFLVMELCTGGELFDRIVEAEHYSERVARDAVRSICEALYFCHQQKVVHLDIKPENILYAAPAGQEGGNILKLCDFGISRSLDPAKGVQGEKFGVTGDGLIRPDGNLHGTASYLAPEMIKRKPYGPKADVWAVGVITYILLAGIPPFDEPEGLEGTEEGTEAMFKDILLGKFFPFEEYECDPGETNPWDEVSEEAKDFIKTLLTPSRESRPDFGAVLQHKWLTGLVADTEIAASKSALSKFNARKKLKNAVKRIMNVNKIRSITAKIAFMPQMNS